MRDPPHAPRETDRAYGGGLLTGLWGGQERGRRRAPRRGASGARVVKRRRGLVAALLAAALMAAAPRGALGSHGPPGMVQSGLPPAPEGCGLPSDTYDEDAAARAEQCGDAALEAAFAASALRCDGEHTSIAANFSAATRTARHYSLPEPLCYGDLPPSWGDHRPMWARWGFYSALPPQRWLHNLEHGGVALMHHPCAPAAARAALEALACEQDEQELARSGQGLRYVVTPSDLLPEHAMVAAVAWEYALVLPCVDFDALAQFVSDNHRNAPEDVASDGTFNTAWRGKCGMLPPAPPHAPPPPPPQALPPPPPHAPPSLPPQSLMAPLPPTTTTSPSPSSPSPSPPPSQPLISLSAVLEGLPEAPTVAAVSLALKAQLPQLAAQFASFAANTLGKVSDDVLTVEEVAAFRLAVAASDDAVVEAPSPPPSPPAGDGDGLPAGAWAGIGVGCAVALASAAGLVACRGPGANMKAGAGAAPPAPEHIINPLNDGNTVAIGSGPVTMRAGAAADEV